MFSVLMTSTMKSEPAGPLACGNAGGTPVSAAATAPEGGNAEGRRGSGSLGDVAEVAALAGVTAVAAPATATPARNLRRSTLACRSSRDIVAPFLLTGAPWRRRSVMSVFLRRLAPFGEAENRDREHTAASGPLT